MLSNIEPSSFALAVITNNTDKLIKVPGIGKKTAARIVLELTDKLKDEQSVSEKENKTAEINLNNEKLEEAISALQVLGYNKRDIEKVIRKLDFENMSLEDIIKDGLK